MLSMINLLFTKRRKYLNTQVHMYITVESCCKSDSINPLSLTVDSEQHFIITNTLLEQH